MVTTVEIQELLAAQIPKPGKPSVLHTWEVESRVLQHLAPCPYPCRHCQWISPNSVSLALRSNSPLQSAPSNCYQMISIALCDEPSYPRDGRGNKLGRFIGAQTVLVRSNAKRPLSVTWETSTSISPLMVYVTFWHCYSDLAAAGVSLSLLPTWGPVMNYSCQFTAQIPN